MITNDELINWASKQHFWVSDAIKTYYEKGEFSEKDIERFAETCIFEQAGKDKRVNLEALNLLQHGQRENWSICSINNVEGVNALKSGQSLVLGEDGLTVVYGDNGAGKSGYIRVLKQISNARYKEDIKGNVFKNDKIAKKCNICIIKGGNKENLLCDLNKPGEHEVLKNIDIFDTKVSKAYVETAKEASYEPWIFSLFSAVANVSSKIRNKLEEKRNVNRLFSIKIPNELSDDPQLKIFSDYSSKTKINEKDYVWNEENEKELQELIKKCNEDALIAQIKQLKNSISSIDTIISELDKYNHFYCIDNVKQIAMLKEKWMDSLEKKNASLLLFEQQATDVDKKSVKNSAWISLWHYAKNYYENVLSENNETKYTTEGGICPLCLQKISKNSLKRIQSIDEFINGKTSEEESRCRKTYVDSLLKLQPCLDDDLINRSIEVGELQDYCETIGNIFNSVRADYDLILQKNYKECEISSIDVKALIDRLNTVRAIREREIDNKKKLLDNEEHILIQSKIKSLKARKFLCDNIGQLLSNISSKKYNEDLDKAESYLNSHSITKKSNDLVSEQLSDEYIKRFNLELKRLTRGNIHVSLVQQRAGKGKVPFKVELLDTEGEKVSPSEILSEGENRVVSLAAFFSDASGRNEDCPLIVDDPISSLDYTYEEAVISRLVQAAKKRQVIVFTHRISMVVGLSEIAKKNNVKFTELRISGRGQEKGVPIPSADFSTGVHGLINKLIDENIAKIKKLAPYDSEYDEKIHYVCQQIRIIVEKSVEEVLLNNVIRRFRRDIKTKGMLEKLASISMDDCKLIDEMMTKYSYYDHSMSDETPLVEFPISEIEADALRIRDWLNDKKNK